MKNKLKLGRIIKEYNDINFGEIEISEFIFFESILTSSGPIYKELKKFELI